MKAYLSQSITKHTSYDSGIYRPPSHCNSKVFSNDLTSLLESHNQIFSYSLIIGDYNIQVNDSENVFNKCLQALINDFAQEQHVTEPMHIKGNILDLVIISKSADNNDKITTHDYSTSDHYLVIADIASAHISHQPAQRRDYRAIKVINRADFAVIC